MKKSIFAALAALSLFALPAAHADEAAIGAQVSSSVSAGDAVPAQSVAGALGKLVGTIAAAPKHLVKTVAPAALDGAATMASDFGTGFKKAFSPDSQTESASSQESSATSSSYGSSATGSNSVSSASSKTESMEAASHTALPASTSKAIAMLRKPPMNLGASTASN